MKTFLPLLLIVAVASLMSVSVVLAQSNAPVAVINAYLAAENARNINAALNLFAHDAVISESPDPLPALTHSGKDEIRAYLQRLVDGYVTVEKVSPPALVNDRVAWTEIISESALVLTRRVEAQVLNGKIKSLQVVEIMRASGRTVPWTGGSGWLDSSIILGLVGLSLLAFGVFVWRRPSGKSI